MRWTRSDEPRPDFAASRRWRARITPSPRPLYQHRHQLDGTDIIREGDEGKTFYVISSGTVEVTIKDIGKVAELHEGDYFGERALVADDKRTATCTAIGNDCRVLTLDREDFVALLGSVEDLVQHGTNEEVEVETTEDRVALDVTLEVLDVQRTLGLSLIHI